MTRRERLAHWIAVAVVGTNQAIGCDREHLLPLSPPAPFWASPLLCRSRKKSMVPTVSPVATNAKPPRTNRTHPFQRTIRNPVKLSRRMAHQGNKCHAPHLQVVGHAAEQPALSENRYELGSANYILPILAHLQVHGWHVADDGRALSHVK